MEPGYVSTQLKRWEVPNCGQKRTGLLLKEPLKEKSPGNYRANV